MAKANSAATRRALDRLRALKDVPAQRLRYAFELIESDPGVEVLMTIMPIIVQGSSAEARPALHRLFRAYDNPKRDPGCYLRESIVQALRRVVLPEDVPLLERAVTTIEPTPNDEPGGARLRAAAVVALADVDPDLAGFHAVSLLADRTYGEMMTGEPATTAVRVLGALGQPLPLVLMVMGGGSHSEVVAACLGELRDVPDAVLTPLIRAVARSRRESIQLGLADLLVRHAPTPPILAAAAKFSAVPKQHDLYRYFVASVVAARHEQLLAVLAHAAEAEPDRQKLAILAEQLAVRRGDPAVSHFLTTVDAKLAETGGPSAPAQPSDVSSQPDDDPDDEERDG